MANLSERRGKYGLCGGSVITQPSVSFLKARIIGRTLAATALLSMCLPLTWARPLVEPISLYSASQRSSLFNACRDVFPQGRPISLAVVSPEWKPRGLCSDNFAVLHSGRSKTPLLVIERLNRAQVLDAKGKRRTNEFYPDPRLPRNERAYLDDFKGSGYDRGHLAPAGDAPSPNAMAQSFALSNMVPQDPVNNQKVWNKLEKDTRKYVMRAAGDVFVFTGPIFDANHATVGRNNVYVPTRLFKLVYDQTSKRAWAQVLPNSAAARLSKPMSYPEFVQQTGWRLLDGLDIR